jgi:hypothetical protein
MPRGNVSKLEYLRPEIIEKYLSGKTGGELVAEYSQIPRATVYRWLKEVKDLTETPTRQPQSDEASTPTVSQSKASLSLVTLPMSDKVEDTLPDLQYLKRKLRKIINTDGDSLSKNDNIRVNAISCYLKVVVIEHGNKQIALEDEDDLQEEEIDYSKLSDEELTDLYHKKLKSI